MVPYMLNLVNWNFAVAGLYFRSMLGVSLRDDLERVWKRLPL
jgi:hypothetical protein